MMDTKMIGVRRPAEPTCGVGGASLRQGFVSAWHLFCLHASGRADYHHPRCTVWSCPSLTTPAPQSGQASGSHTLRGGMLSLTGTNSVASWSTTSENDASVRKR